MITTASRIPRHIKNHSIKNLRPTSILGLLLLIRDVTDYLVQGLLLLVIEDDTLASETPIEREDHVHVLLHILTKSDAIIGE